MGRPDAQKEIIMAFGMNVYSAVGRLGGDAEIREREGRRVASFRVAVDDSYQGSDGNRVDRTVWLTAFTFQKGLIGILEKHGKSGAAVAVSGQLSQRSYDRDGESSSRTVTELRLGPGSSMTFL